MILTPRQWRDPDNFMFQRRDRVWIQIQRRYATAYDQLMQEDGLYEQLVAAGLMLRHQEAGLKYARTDNAYRVLRQQTVPFVSYPHEWGFGQWQAAALCVLDVQQMALQHGMMLKRATPYSVQFMGNQPVWTDIAAFTPIAEGMRWRAYGQFVAEILNPLALMSYVTADAGNRLQTSPDGIPSALVSSLLPVRTRMNIGITSHIHSGGREFSMGRIDLQGQVNSLRETVESLKWKPDQPVVQDKNTYDEATALHRQMLVRGMLGTINPTVTWDMHAVDGTFAGLAAEYSDLTVAFADDMAHVTWMWEALADDARVLPLVVDWRNPSPTLGINGLEARSIVARANAEVLLVLGGVPFISLAELADALLLDRVVSYLARLAPNLIIEYIPAHDPAMIARLPAGDDAPTVLDAEAFEAVFRPYYSLVQAEGVKHTERMLYHMRRREETA